MKFAITKKLTASFATLIMLATSLFMMSAAHAQSVSITSGPHDCDNNAVIKCGVKNVDEIQSSYKKSSSTRAIYAYFGISASDINGLDNADVVTGQVTKSGDVIVKGKVVAHDALTAGRQYIKGSTKVTKDGVTFYTRKPSVSFQNNSLQAFVVMKNGTFQFAILAACGNPVKATPPKPPKPQPKPSMSCDQLAFSKKNDYDYTLTAQASVKNASIVSYTFTFGDGKTQTVTTNKTSASAPHTYKPGSYNASVSVTFNVGGKKQTLTSPKCAGKVTVNQPAAEVACEQLSADGKELAFTFSASGSAKNATINSFTFVFGDKTAPQTVAAANNKATTNHTYAKTGEYTAIVTVNYTDLNGKKLTTTSAKCAVKVSPKQPMCTVPGKENLPADSPECKPTPVFSCDELVITNKKGEDTTSLQYAFTVKASAENTTIESYTINFGDGTPAYIGATPAADHAYAKPGTYNITASIKVKDQAQPVTSEACTGKVTITPPMCTVPGKENLPADSPECKPETPPVTPPETPEVPPTLPNTGAGQTIGLFSGIVIAGAAAHRLFMNRRFGNR